MMVTLDSYSWATKGFAMLSMLLLSVLGSRHLSIY